VMLSPHFSLAEATRSGTALRLGIANVPSLQVVEHMRIAAVGMEQVRSLLDVPVHVNSWFRCEALERILCEKDYRAWCARHSKSVTADTWAEYFARKQHPQGLAIDFTAASYGSPAEVAKRIAGSALRFDQLIEEGTWVHIGFGAAMRQQVLVARFANGTPSYSPA
jgi:hypothetical protein